MPERFNQFFGILAEHAVRKAVVYVLPYMPAELNVYDARCLAFEQRRGKSVFGCPVCGIGSRSCCKSRTA